MSFFFSNKSPEEASLHTETSHRERLHHQPQRLQGCLQSALEYRQAECASSSSEPGPAGVKRLLLPLLQLKWQTAATWPTNWPP